MTQPRSTAMKPQNFEEQLVWYCLIGTYVLYIFALLSPLNSLLGWALFVYLLKKIWDQTKGVETEKSIKVPWVLWLWVICMPIMAITSVVALHDWGMGTQEILGGVRTWFLGWALLALFPAAGCLNIRPALIYRAVCIVCLQSLVAIPLCYIAYLVRLPAVIYSSPIQGLFKNGPIYYTVSLYAFDDIGHEFRLGLFAPWAPALGIVGSIYFFLALQEPDKRWRFIGIAGAIAMSVVSASRIALLALPIVMVVVWVLLNLRQPIILIPAGFLSFLCGIFSPQLLQAAEDFKDGILGARSESTRVRAALVRIAFERSKESPWWGHGRTAPGSKVVENMPIGSHTTWGGLMFINGKIGLIAFIIPFVTTGIALMVKAQKYAIARASFSIFLILLFFSISETLDTLAYLCWPGWLLIGMALKEDSQSSMSLES